jgi:phosphotriesterase-related protein
VNGLVRTALGDIEATALGRTDYHEHLFQVTPLLPGDELDDEERSGEEARLLHAAGIDAMVEATPTGLGRDPDPGLHAELAAAGAYLGYDGMARSRTWPDSALIECLLRVTARGGARRVLLGGDVARRTRYVAYGGMPGLAYLPERFVPRLEAEGGPELVRSVLVDNPARLLAWSAR